MSWIDTLVVTVIVIAGLFIFYRALKEPLDLFFGLVKRGINAIVESVRNMKSGGGDYVETIRYG